MPRATRAFLFVGLALFECQAFSLNVWSSGRKGTSSRTARVPDPPYPIGNPSSNFIPTPNANASAAPTTPLPADGRLPLGTRLLNAAMPRRQEGMPEEYVRMVSWYLNWIELQDAQLL